MLLFPLLSGTTGVFSKAEYGSLDECRIFPLGIPPLCSKSAASATSGKGKQKFSSDPCGKLDSDQTYQKKLSKHCFCGIRASVANPPSAGLIEKGPFCIKSICYSAAREAKCVCVRMCTQMVMSGCQPLPPSITQNIPNIISFPFCRQSF